MKNRNGFTLVELLAVIAILAILVIIALPSVINMYNRAQKQTFLTEAKKVYSESEKKYLSNVISGEKTKVISSEDGSKLDMTGKKLQYCVILNNSGKVTDMKVSNGKWVAGLNGKAIEDLTIDDLEEGSLDDYECSVSIGPSPVYCTFDGDLVQGAEYINGQYTYRYMQEGTPDYSSPTASNELNYGIKRLSSPYNVVPMGIVIPKFVWTNMNSAGWGVTLTDKESTDPVNSKLCTYINNKPVVSMAYMFINSSSTSIDLSSFNTSNVTNMDSMFAYASFSSLDLSGFNTSKVTNMNQMFYNNEATSIDLSNFNTSKIKNMGWMFFGTNVTSLDLSSFDTSNVTFMGMMFSACSASVLDLSSFDTSKVTDMYDMFSYCGNLKTIYVGNKFITDNVTSDSYMFFRASKLVGGAGTTFDSNNTGKEYARIDGGTSSPGYFTLKQ